MRQEIYENKDRLSKRQKWNKNLTKSMSKRQNVYRIRGRWWLNHQIVCTKEDPKKFHAMFQKEKVMTPPHQQIQLFKYFNDKLSYKLISRQVEKFINRNEKTCINMHMVDPSFLVDWIRLTFIYIFLILCLNLKNIFYIEITYKLTVKKKGWQALHTQELQINKICSPTKNTNIKSI